MSEGLESPKSLSEIGLSVTGLYTDFQIRLQKPVGNKEGFVLTSLTCSHLLHLLGLVTAGDFCTFSISQLISIVSYRIESVRKIL